ncbi:MAG: DNA replication and repair protein RecF [Pyrinomonadaceae bacterium]|nr:DNA replication and repair protein RecF [Pyrinomonadaceae bacterium]
MQLEMIEAQGFRNLRGRIDCGRGLNVFYGENGHGKTNWLEAIYLLATTKSFKTARLNEAIRFSEELAIVRGRVRQSEGIHRDLQVAIQGNVKTFSTNGKREILTRYLGELHAVIFNSDELDIVRGQPDARRRFMDGGIVSLHPPFIQTFTDYGKVIRQKNSLLQTARDKDYSLEKTAEMLIPWNEQLIALAARIHRGRLRFVDRVNEVLEKRLFGREELSVRYVSSLEGKGDLSDYEGLLAERLSLRVQAEVVAGHALVGPHRDDLEILFDGHDIRKFGSAGQQRSALLALLLAGIAVFNATRGEYPLFLLDDIDAELDYRRIGQLLDFLDGKTQTFVTTSKSSFVEQFGRSAAVFSVRDGLIEPLDISTL